MKKGICLVLAMLLLASLLWGCAEESSRSNRSTRDRDETESHSKTDFFDSTPGFDFIQSDMKIDGDPATLIVGTWIAVEATSSWGEHEVNEDYDEDAMITLLPDGSAIHFDTVKWYVIGDQLYLVTDDDNCLIYDILALNEDEMIVKMNLDDGEWIENRLERVN